MPPATQITSGAVIPGGAVHVIAPGVVNVLTAVAGSDPNAAQHSNAKPPAAVTGCGSGPDRTRVPSDALGVNSQEEMLLFCVATGAGM